MEQTPAAAHFQTAYVEGEPPWVIGEPQPAVVDLERAGWITGPVLDLGCGAGEHAVLLAGRGYRTVAADAAPAAIERTRAAAEAAGVTVEAAVVDAMEPAGLGRFATVLDSALFHIFDADDQIRYARALADVVEPGGHVVLLGLSDEGPGFGPQIGADEIRGAFTAPTWDVETLMRSAYRGKVTHDDQATGLGVPIGELVDLPAWLARIRRTG